MENNIKISVIIPIYNAEKYLEKCLDSIISQSLKEIEIICVNDGSTDNSLEILKKLQLEDKRIIVINKKNGGSSSARNAALKVARGEYCLNIDSDDWIEQGYFKAIYEKAKKNEVDILITDMIFDYQTDTKENEIKIDLKLEEDKVISGKEYVKIFFTNNFYGYTWNKLIKRKLYIENNLCYDEEIFLLEDVELLMMLAYYAKKIGKLNRGYYHYIIGENNGSNKIKIKLLYDRITCFNKLIKFYKEKKEEKIIKIIEKANILTMIPNILENNYEIFKEYNNFLITIVKQIKNYEGIIRRKKEESGTLYLVIVANTLKIFPLCMSKNIIRFFRKISNLKKNIIAKRS